MGRDVVLRTDAQADAQSPFRSDLLDGGEAGKAFESMYDERLSESMASDASDTLVQSIVRKIEGSKAYARQVQKAQQEINSEREGRGSHARAFHGSEPCRVIFLICIPSSLS